MADPTMLDTLVDVDAQCSVVWCVWKIWCNDTTQESRV
jgi:hypothetical protein